VAMTSVDVSVSAGLPGGITNGAGLPAGLPAGSGTAVPRIVAISSGEAGWAMHSLGSGATGYAAGVGDCAGVDLVAARQNRSVRMGTLSLRSENRSTVILHQ
jgi:hypothetical protein